jgi:Na+-driven multidrug efflux pump
MDEDSFKGLNEIITVGYNSFLVKVMGWWAFDVFTQFAALLTETDTAAQTILRNIGLFTYMIPVGLMSSTNYFVGMYIGMNRVDLAKKIGGLLSQVTLAWSFASMVIVFFWRDAIMDIYTCDESIKDVMKKAWTVICIFVFFDCM